MRIGTIYHDNTTTAVVYQPERGVITAQDLLGDGSYRDALDLLSRWSAAGLSDALASADPKAYLPVSEVRIDAPYRRPRMIWGIGLNYVEHASDLQALRPEDEPASFIKADHTVIGPGENIVIPQQSQRTTAEAEVGLVIGTLCRNVSETEALEYVWGVVPVLDQTAEDILQRNPRFLTRSKNFPTFFSFGPWIVSMDELMREHPNIADVRVSTVHNGAEHRSNTVSNMTFSPAMLVSFHSHVMPLQPGDIISTGTPGAIHITHGDVVQAKVSGVGVLSNPVIHQP